MQVMTEIRPRLYTSRYPYYLWDEADNATRDLNVKHVQKAAMKLLPNEDAKEKLREAIEIDIEDNNSDDLAIDADDIVALSEKLKKEIEQGTAKAESFIDALKDLWNY